MCGRVILSMQMKIKKFLLQKYVTNSRGGGMSDKNIDVMFCKFG